jgi:hypothetical protein
MRYSCNAVGGADYVVWRNNLGQNFDLPNRDPALFGPINEFDYEVWRESFGSPSTMDLAQPSDFNHLIFEGDWQVWFEPYNGTEANQETNFVHLYQDVPGTPGLSYTMKGWADFEDFFPGGVDFLNAEANGVPSSCRPEDCFDGLPSPTDTFFAIEFLDANNVVLPGSLVKELKADGQLLTPFPDEKLWMQHTLTAVAPANTVKVRVRASMINGVFNPLPDPEVFNMSFFVDSFSLTAAPASGLASSVPEPTAAILGALATWGLLSATRRRRLEHV